MKNTLNLPALNLSDAAWLSHTIAKNKGRFSGWSMELDTAAQAAADAAAAAADAAAQAAAEGEKGFPANTPVAEMTAEQQTAYWRDKAQVHEGRNKDLLRITGNKYGDTLRQDLAELATLRDQTRTDSERAVEEARNQTRTEVRTELGTDAARVAFEFALRHDPETNDQGTLIDTLDLTKVLTEDGKVDTAKVRAIADRIAPADKGTGRDADYGAGHRKTTAASGVGAGAELYAASRKKSTSST